MRKGLHPLSVHLGMSAAKAAGMDEYIAHFPSSYSQDKLVDMVRGIKQYQEHPYTQPRLETEEVWSNGSVKVVKPITAPQGAGDMPPILLVPSLINKSYILDLSEKRSLLRFLTQNGVHAYLLDWGDLTNEGGDAQITVNDLIEEKLCGAIRAVSGIHDQPIDVLGYCMGGTLLVPAAQMVQAHIRRIVFLATPWDFHAQTADQEDNLARAVRIWSPIVLPIIREKGVLPSSYVQALFASLSADETIRKFTRFASMDQDSAEAEFFVSVEDWLNDDVDIPGSVAQGCIQGWFLDNTPAKGQWVVAARAVKAQDVKAETLLITSRKDRLVPYACAMALKDQMTHARCDVIETSTGHIGMIVGKRAVSNIWSPILEWLKS